MMTSNNKGTFLSFFSLSLSQFSGKWTCFPLKDLDQGVASSSALLMGHHMVMMVHDCTPFDSSRVSDGESFEPATILAVNLHDNSVQGHKMHDFYYHEEYSLVKYKDNQIIKFGGKKNKKVLKDILWITIKSFNRNSLTFNISFI